MNARIARGILIIAGCASAVPCVVAAATQAASQVRPSLAGLSVPFVRNAGQWNPRAAFGAHLFAGTVFVTTDGKLVYSLPGGAIDESATRYREQGGRALPASNRAARTPRAAAASHATSVLTETLVDAGGRPVALAPRGSRQRETTVSYFVGDDPRSTQGALATFERVDLGELAPGVAIELRATGRNVEKIFTIAPARDPGVIRVQLDGAERLAVGEGGELIAQTGNGPVVFTAPVAYQEDDRGYHARVPVRYELAPGATTYSFAVGEYDPAHALIIDPLLQATYLGGSSDDFIYGMAIHPASGDVYVAGTTLSTDLPCTTALAGCSDGAQKQHAVVGGGSGYDGFVARLSADLRTLLQVTYLGGSRDDFLMAIAIHPVSGEVLVAGDTVSTNLACTTADVITGCADGAQPAHAVVGGGSGRDGFLARFNAGLTTLLQATYLGGSRDEFVSALTIHPITGEVLVAGATMSTNFPATSGGAQATHGADGGTLDGFVARLNPSLTGLLQATYYGGADYDDIVALAVDPMSGEVVAGGTTISTALPCTASFPCSVGAQSTAPAAYPTQAGFLVRFAANLVDMVQATYLGGSDATFVNAIAIHPVNGEVLAAGNTLATDFPCTSSLTAGCETPQGPFNTGVSDGFVARLNPGLTRILQATYYGGYENDYFNALAVHPATGEIYAAGQTKSTNLFCTTLTGSCGNGAQAAHAAVGGGDGYDGFVARFSPALTRTPQATYLGGSRDDSITTIAVHPVSGEVLVAGYTHSTNFPCTSTLFGCPNGAQPVNGGTSAVFEGFVSRLTADLTLEDNVPDPFSFAPRGNVPRYSVQTSDPVHVSGITGAADIYPEGQPGSTYCVSSTNSCACDVNGGFYAYTDTIQNNRYVCVRHTASGATNRATYTDLHIGGAMATFYVTTGTLLGNNCSLDVDGNNAIDALTDGLLILRAMLGLTGTAVTDHAVAGDASRTTWAQIRPFLNGNCGTSFAQ